MKTLINIFRELAGLFIDDGLFALAISVVVVLARSLPRLRRPCRLPRASCCSSAAWGCYWAT